MKHDKNTRARILDVAEELFGEQGFDRVSIRDITRQAQVNLAAINYHFGGKEELIVAVFERHFVPVNQARLAALSALEESAQGSSPKLEDILEAFIRPTVQCSFATAKSAKAFSKLFGRCLCEPNPDIEELLKRQFEPLMKRMDAALMRALPQLTRSEIFWRMKFTFGALHHWLLTRERCLPSGLEKLDVTAQIKTLISFAAAGFRSV